MLQWLRGPWELRNLYVDIVQGGECRWRIDQIILGCVANKKFDALFRQVVEVQASAEKPKGKSPPFEMGIV